MHTPTEILIPVALYAHAAVRHALQQPWFWNASAALAVVSAIGTILLLLRQKQRLHTALQRAGQDMWSLQTLVAHEIRAPLSSVAQLLELTLNADATTDCANARIRAAHDSVQILLELLETLLTQSKLDKGRLTLTPRPTDPSTLIHELEQLLAPLAAQKGLRLLTRIDGPSVRVQCDAVRLRQILLNLLSNAIKFTPRGFVSLQFSWHPGNAGAQIEFLIGDSGIGMSRSLLAHLDTPFCSEGEAARQQFGGHGIGLALARQLTRLMKGDMRIDSAPECGTRIRLGFEFPLAEAQDALGPASEPPLHALIAEDSPASRLLLSQQLEATGVKATSCANGWLALRNWIVEHPDIVFCDAHIPQLDGLTLCRRIRRLERKGNRFPTVLVCISALPPPHDHPYDLILNKPVGSAALQEALDYCRSNRKPGCPPVDFDLVDRLALRNDRFERRLLRTTLASMARDGHSLQCAHHRGDLQRSAACAHQLLGVARMLCSNAMSRRCAQLEAAARARDHAETMRLLPLVAQDIACVMHCLRRRLRAEDRRQA